MYKNVDILCLESLTKIDSYLWFIEKTLNYYIKKKIKHVLSLSLSICFLRSGSRVLKI